MRPIRDRLADRVRAHMFSRMLSYYISWHMKQALTPILFHDHDKPAAAAKRPNPVVAAQRSDAALAKAARKHTADNTPVHSFTSLLADLATICANHIQPADDLPAFTMLTTPTPTATTGLRTPRRHLPPRHVVSGQPKIPGQHPPVTAPGGNFGLGCHDTFQNDVREPVSNRCQRHWSAWLIPLVQPSCNSGDGEHQQLWVD